MRAPLHPGRTRGFLRSSARVSLDVLLLLVMAAVVVWLLGKAWSVVWPVVLALLLTTLTWPVARFLRARGWPATLAASAVTIAFLVLVAGLLALIVVPVAAQADDLVDGVTRGVEQLREWASGPPLNIGDDQLTEALDSAVATLSDSAGQVASITATGFGAVLNGLVTAVLAVLLMFLFLKDGTKFSGWLAEQVPGRLATDLPVVAGRCWSTLGAFVRSQAFVGLVDAVLIGVGLWIVGVPLVLPLAVLTFVAAFVPIVGAFFSGAVALLITLVYNGFPETLIVLGIIVAVQQLEGNVLQPMVQSRGLGLHAGVVLLAVTLGSSLAGVVGALLAVPVTAIVAVIWGYLREELRAPAPDAPAPDADPA